MVREVRLVVHLAERGAGLALGPRPELVAIGGVDLGGATDDRRAFLVVRRGPRRLGGLGLGRGPRDVVRRRTPDGRDQPARGRLAVLDRGAGAGLPGRDERRQPAGRRGLRRVGCDRGHHCPPSVDAAPGAPASRRPALGVRPWPARGDGALPGRRVAPDLAAGEHGVDQAFLEIGGVLPRPELEGHLSRVGDELADPGVGVVAGDDHELHRTERRGLVPAERVEARRDVVAELRAGARRGAARAGRAAPVSTNRSRSSPTTSAADGIPWAAGISRSAIALSVARSAASRLASGSSAAVAGDVSRALTPAPAARTGSRPCGRPRAARSRRSSTSGSPRTT